MRPLIIGTAGHVDHGKTALTRALTGVDTDRLAEEKRRGLTIELGFAPLPLPGGRPASIVDVPGHEAFVPTMLSGASGIDLALLVIAADEGVMPQTREHLAILSLLGVRGGVLVLTKADRVDGRRLAQAEAQVRAAAQGTFLEDAPVLAVSATTGEGMEALREQLAALADQWSAPPEQGPFRLNVDRSFSVEGSGAVVTGTLTGGPLARGNVLTVYPAGISARVRGLQRHGQPAERLEPGSRTAVNLAGIKSGQVRRGDTLATPGSLVLTNRADVSLTLLPDAPFGVKHNAQLHLYHGARSMVCRCVLLGRDELTPGQSGFAQLRLPRPLAALPGDRFVVRFFSPEVTLGGGVLLDLAPPLRGRNASERTQALETLARGAPEARAALLLKRAGTIPLPVENLVRDARLEPEALPGLLERVHAAEAGGHVLGYETLEALEAQTRSLLTEQPGLNQGALLARLFPGGAEGGAAFLARLTRRLRLEQAEGGFYLPGTLPSGGPEEASLLARYVSAGLCPPSDRELEGQFPAGPAAFRRAVRALTQRGSLAVLSPQYRVHAPAAAEALAALRLRFGAAPFTLAQVRDQLGVSRKYALLFAEYWDKLGITRKTGDARVFC